MKNAKFYFEQLASLSGIFIFDGQLKNNEAGCLPLWFEYEYLCYDVYGFGKCELIKNCLTFKFNFELFQKGIEIGIIGGVNKVGHIFVDQFSCRSLKEYHAHAMVSSDLHLNFSVSARQTVKNKKYRKYWYFQCQPNQIFPELLPI